MSSFACTAEALTILPHPNADLLELAVVGAYRAVVAKGAYTSGEVAVYIPEAAILPESLVVELGLVGRLAGREDNRVKAIRLRGELSQGIVCRPSALAGYDLAAAASAGTDLADALGITKWVPEIPAHMQGTAIAAPDLLRWIEIENIKRHPETFVAGELIAATEKIHGTCSLLSYDATTEAVNVSSKGIGAKGMAFVRDPDNLYWRAVITHDIEAVLPRLAARLGARRLGLFGETYGASAQDLHYGLASRNRPGYAIFDYFVVPAERPGYWLDTADLRALGEEYGLPLVPLLYVGPYNYADLAALAEGPTVAGSGAHLREGLVVRALHERRTDGGDRAIAKFISTAYLLRKGEATEFE